MFPPESPVASISHIFQMSRKINLRCRLIRGGQLKVPAVAVVAAVPGAIAAFEVEPEGSCCGVLAVVPGATAAVEVEPERASSAEVI